MKRWNAALIGVIKKRFGIFTLKIRVTRAFQWPIGGFFLETPEFLGKIFMLCFFGKEKTNKLSKTCEVGWNCLIPFFPTPKAFFNRGNFLLRTQTIDWWTPPQIIRTINCIKFDPPKDGYICYMIPWSLLKGISCFFCFLPRNATLKFWIFLQASDGGNL